MLTLTTPALVVSTLSTVCWNVFSSAHSFSIASRVFLSGISCCLAFSSLAHGVSIKLKHGHLITPTKGTPFLSKNIGPTRGVPNVMSPPRNPDLKVQNSDFS